MFEQLIIQPAHIVNNTRSCIDHIFTNNDLDILTDVGVGA